MSCVKPSSRPSTTSLLCRLSFLCISLILLGCPDKPKYPNCTKDKDCKEGQYCVQQRCSECSSDEHCESFETCENGSCALKPNACRTSDDCLGGRICEDNQCVACENDGQCGPGKRCSNGACMAQNACATDEDCQDDEDCVNGGCQRADMAADSGAMCKMESVHFAFDDFGIQESEQTSLEATVECIATDSTKTVALIGHTDAIGTEEYNIALSEKRARAVKNFLTRLGIDENRLQEVPKGESESTATDESSRALERRVDIEWRQ